MAEQRMIGTATMDAEGTISLQLRAETDAGETGDALLVYRKGDPNYDAVLKHLSGLAPGKEVPVPPFPTGD